MEIPLKSILPVIGALRIVHFHKQKQPDDSAAGRTKPEHAPVKMQETVNILLLTGDQIRMDMQQRKALQPGNHQ
jgi:hypothetical protein